ncbi:MAG: peptidoglycan-binding protein [Actinomycetota bacterium]
MKRRAAVVTVAMTVVALGAAGFAYTTRDDSPAAANTAPKQQGKTAKVTRQDLVQTESYDGTLGYAEARTVTAGRAGTVTGLASEGTTVNRGGALYALDESAVRLMYGAVPAYRNLGPGVTDGTDVRQVEANLKALGFGGDGLDVDGDWDAATTRSVKRWQKKLGVTKTGQLPLGSIVFLGGPVRIGEHKMSTGEAAAPGAAVLQVTSTSREATVNLDASKAAIAALREAVAVKITDGASAKGAVSAIAAVAHSGAGDGSSPVIPVTVTLAPKEARKLGSLDQAPVEVVFEKSRAKAVLTVPVTALVALAEGGYAVEVPTGATSKLIGVEPGEFADGRVEVTGTGITEGMSVVVPS